MAGMMWGKRDAPNVRFSLTGKGSTALAAVMCYGQGQREHTQDKG